MTAEVLLHPIRLRIVQALVGNPMTTMELIEAMGDVPQASVYRHVRRLQKSGLLEVMQERPVRGVVERTYAVVESEVRLGPEDLATVSEDEHRRYFATFVGSLISGFDRYLDAGTPDFGRDGVGYQQTPMWLTDQEFTDMAAELADVLANAHKKEPAPGRTRRLVATVIYPDA